MSSREENWAHRLEEQEPEENQALESDDEETASLYLSCSSSSSSSTYFSAVSMQDWMEEGAEAMALDPWPRRPHGNPCSNQGAGGRDGNELAHKLDSKSSVDQEHKKMAMWQVLGESSCKTGSRLEQVEESCNQGGEGEDQEEEAEEGEEWEGEEIEQDEGEEEEEGIAEEEAEVERERKEEEKEEEEGQGEEKEGDGAGSEDSSLPSKKPQEKMVN